VTFSKAKPVELEEPKLLLVKNGILQIAKKSIRIGRLALSDLKNEFC
jgi:hypothetical protein